MRASLDHHPARQAHSGRKVGVALHDAIVLDDASGVDNGIGLDARVRVEDAGREYYGPRRDRNTGADHG